MSVTSIIIHYFFLTVNTPFIDIIPHMKTIALFGGSFDPVHIGHTLVVNQILELRPDIEKIILVPAFKHQWKQSYATNKDRLAMLGNLVSKRVEVSEIELKRKGISYTIDTAA